MSHRNLSFSLTASWIAAAAICLEASADEAVQRGYQLLVSTPLLTSDFSQEVFDHVWQVWPEPLRRDAEKVSLERRRRMAFDRYGLTTRPGDDSLKPLQYVVDSNGD